jgi:hypothetical protein
MAATQQHHHVAPHTGDVAVHRRRPTLDTAQLGRGAHGPVSHVQEGCRWPQPRHRPPWLSPQPGQRQPKGTSNPPGLAGTTWLTSQAAKCGGERNQPRRGGRLLTGLSRAVVARSAGSVRSRRTAPHSTNRGAQRPDETPRATAPHSRATHTRDQRRRRCTPVRCPTGRGTSRACLARAGRVSLAAAAAQPTVRLTAARAAPAPLERHQQRRRWVGDLARGGVTARAGVNVQVVAYAQLACARLR